MQSEQKNKLRAELERLKILGWDHCDHCNRSQCRFEFYYQEQFDEAAKAAEPCVFCDNSVITCHEDESGPFIRPEGWKVPNRAEFKKQLMELNEEFGCEILTVDKFKSSHADYMHRAIAVK